MGNNAPHQPVLLKETISLLMTNPDGTYLDGTIGFGGHSEKILKKLSQTGFLIGLDLDPYALEYTNKRLSKIQQNYSLHNTSYREYPQLLQKLGVDKLTGILLDLGSSSSQINTGHRGFSFQNNAPLNMRFNPNSKPNAAEYLNESSLEEIECTIKTYGEEKNYKKIAKCIYEEIKKNKMHTTFDLKNAILKCTSHKHIAKTLARVFQAIRIKVNDELNILKDTLANSIKWINEGGRIVVISFHSLEDRIVKEFFSKESQSCTCPKEIPVCICNTSPSLKTLNRKIIKPTEEEIMANSRSRSAKLRVAEKV